MKILIATSNEHKKKELEELFAGHTLVMPSETGITFDCIEDGTTFAANAMIKAQALRKAAKGFKMAILADDSGLLVDALPGQLGVRTARFGAPDDSHLLTAHEKNMLLLNKLENVPDSKRTARFCCSLVLIYPDGKILTSEGIAEGRILKQETGDGGFGFDPVFYCDEASSPMAELSKEEKNVYSHRGKAAAQLLQLIKEE